MGVSLRVELPRTPAKRGMRMERKRRHGCCSRGKTLWCLRLRDERQTGGEIDEGAGHTHRGRSGKTGAERLAATCCLEPGGAQMRPASRGNEDCNKTREKNGH